MINKLSANDECTLIIFNCGLSSQVAFFLSDFFFKKLPPYVHMYPGIRSHDP
jgi:hypothetical protein